MDSSLKNFEILHLRNEKFVKPFTLRFEIDGQARFGIASRFTIVFPF